MRLTERELAGIREAARIVFGDKAVVRLFGSRVDDRKKGGDIDLHVEVDRVENHISAIGRFDLELERRLGERKIDIVLRTEDMPERLIDRIAKEKGVRL